MFTMILNTLGCVLAVIRPNTKSEVRKTTKSEVLTRVWLEPELVRTIGSNQLLVLSRIAFFDYFNFPKLPKPTYLRPKTFMTLGFRPKGYKKALNKPFTCMKNRVTHL